MEPEQDNFDSLRRMLALKRHEVPPPGFFDSFPDRVRARIRSEEAPAAHPWWARWQERWLWRPALAGACVLMAAGFVAWKLGDGGSLPAGGGSLTVQGVHGTPPAARPQPFLVGGGAPMGLPVRGASSTAPVTDGAPPGLFAPGAGMRWPMAPVSAGRLSQPGNQESLPTNAVVPSP